MGKVGNDNDIKDTYLNVMGPATGRIAAFADTVMEAPLQYRRCGIGYH